MANATRAHERPNMADGEYFRLYPHRLAPLSQLPVGRTRTSLQMSQKPQQIETSRQDANRRLGAQRGW